MSTSAASGYADACVPLMMGCLACAVCSARDAGGEEHAKPVATTPRASEVTSDRLMAHDSFARPPAWAWVKCCADSAPSGWNLRTWNSGPCAVHSLGVF